MTATKLLTQIFKKALSTLKSKDFRRGIVRTFVPLVVAVLGHFGVTEYVSDEALVSYASYGVGIIYYVGVGAFERGVNSKFGKLLGVEGAPSYEEFDFEAAVDEAIRRIREEDEGIEAENGNDSATPEISGQQELFNFDMDAYRKSLEAK